MRLSQCWAWARTAAEPPHSLPSGLGLTGPATCILLGVTPLTSRCLALGWGG